MTENSLKPYLFDSFYRWTENNNLDVYLEFKTNNIVLPEYFKKKKRIKLKISKKTCFDLKIHTNGVSFFVYINKNKEDIFIPHSEWISLTSNNEILDFIKELEDNGDVFVIRPKKPVNIGRTEKNREKLEALYNDGYNDAKDCYEELLKYLGKENL